MSRLAGGLAALVALSAISGRTMAQPPRVQDMAFGGGGHYEFLIPVQAQGRIFAQVTWGTNVTLNAELYSPDRGDPVTVTRGSGLLQISHAVTSWHAGDQWLLKLTADDDSPDLRGRLHVVWPAGNRPASVVRWQNAGPLDPETRLALKEGVGRLSGALAVAGAPSSAVATDPAVRGDLRRLTTALATRLDVLDQLPDRYIVNDVSPSSTTMTVGPVASSPVGTVRASLLELVCVHHKPWHTHGTADNPFVVAAFIGDGGPLSIEHTVMFEAVQRGDAPVASALGQELLRITGRTATHLALALYEGEGGTIEQTTAHFQRAVELYELYSALNGGGDPATFAWMVAITTENTNDVIGTPRLMAIAPSRDSLSPTTKLGFAGHGARYEVAVQVRSR